VFCHEGCGLSVAVLRFTNRLRTLPCHGTFGKFREWIGTTAKGGHGRELRVMSGYKAGA
jgi:hypothetical protein